MFFKKNHFACFLFILTFFSSNAWCEILIEQWKEEITLTRTGKQNYVILRAKIQDLEKNSYHDGFTIIFDKKQEVKIKNVIIDGKKPKFTFKIQKAKEKKSKT